MKPVLSSGRLPIVVVACLARGRDAAGIEIVVEDDAVDVVLLYQLLADIHDALIGCIEGGIEDDGGCAAGIGVAEQHLGILESAVLGCTPSFGIGRPSVGIDPRMALQSAIVALLNHERQRVPSRIPTSLICQITGPRLIAGLLESIAHRTNLKIDGVEVVFLKHVQIPNHLLLLLIANADSIASRARPIDAIDSRHPYAAHFALDESVCTEGRKGEKVKKGKDEKGKVS